MNMENFSMENFETTSQRRMREVFEHRPSELLFSVNGFVLSSLKVTAERSEQTQSINIDEKVSFVEVFSEQGVRLLFLDVEPLPDGPVVQTIELELSDNRKLQLRLSFSDPRPTLRAVYQDPLMKTLGSGYASEETELAEGRSSMPAQQAWYEREAKGFYKSDHSTLLSKVRNVVRSLLSPIQLAVHSLSSNKSVWRPVVASAVAVVVLAVVTWVWTGPRSSVSADEIFREAGLRERAWTYQPNKVLHWVIESDRTNHPMRLDGRYVSHHWQNNYPGQGTRLIRSYDQNGKLAYAIWDKPDGSSVLFSNVYPDQVSILPTRAEWQQFITKILKEDADKLEPASRQQLEARLKEAEEDADFYDPTRLFEQAVSQVRRSLKNAKLEVIYTPGVGKTFRIRDEFNERTPQGGTMRHVLEEDIAADTFRRFRLKEIRYLPDGKTAVSNARWTLFEETSIADLEAHDLRDLIASGKRIVRRTPEELLKKTIRYKSQGM